MKYKKIMELIFIFILPLLFILPCISINKSYDYDNNGNYETSELTIDYNQTLYQDTYTDDSGTKETPFKILHDLIVDNLHLNNTTTVNIMIDYTVMWFIMFILWHFFYLFFDMLVHIFIDWGHKEREKLE